MLALTPTNLFVATDQARKASSSIEPPSEMILTKNTRSSVWALPATLICMVLCGACHSAKRDRLFLDDYQLAVAQSGIAVGALKALDAGNTNRAYRITLIHLKETMLRTQWHVSRGAVPPKERAVLQAISQVVLSYLEQQRDRLGETALLDHCGLELTRVLADTLTDPEDLRRVQTLKDYFSGRFVEERRWYE